MLELDGEVVERVDPHIGLLAGVSAIIGSFDIVFGEIDR
jgi:NADH:ubiquinone oxidoreductase subunit D